ncbi:MAG: SOS response-associated peptidase [Bacteroidota bacterium]|nr:SOS response-associated peptidase [Candidatus Kapabacteria bacterium]MCX7936179.1 SOS response-associated peptidase [Chlorobiota bacterium]MDW8074927.1 SOS response-associated peptidase [Bacteroidota bacterium]
MCGRFVLVASAEQIGKTFGVSAEHNVARYNIAPAQQILTIIAAAGGRQIEWAWWGLRRHDGSLLINIRSETALTKPHFRRFLEQSRCLVPISGFYEWTGTKQRLPYYITAARHPLLGLAGVRVLDTDDETGQPIYRCAILTCAAIEPIAHLHPRMPLVVPSQLYDEWLNQTGDIGELLGRILDAPSLEWHYYRVSPRVGNVRNDDPSLIAPADDLQQSLL